MTNHANKRQTQTLEQLKHAFDARSARRTIELLGQLTRARFSDAALFAAYHETVLFIAAYPANRAVRSAADRALRAVPAQVRAMQGAGIDLSPLDEADLSGIAGTSVSGVFSYPVAAWLAREHPAEVSIDWEGYTDEARLAETWPRFMPLLEDETMVEAHFPYLEWLAAAAGTPEKALPWLIARFADLRLEYPSQAELYNSLRLYPVWKPTRFASSRTGMRFPSRKTFYHQGPMIARRDVSLEKELDGPQLPSTQLSLKEGAAILELIRQTSTQRYRELHGFSYGDPASFIRFDAGRGIDIYLNEVTPDRRLPLRAYHSGFLVKNGVPIGYVEGLSLFDRMEIGFNIYYTFRDGESAYLYAKVMQIFHQALGINCFSVDPYQIGHENEEGLASGAFWFYRKLGFQPTRPELLRLVQKEERKIVTKAGYRTGIEALARIAEGHIHFDHLADAPRNWSNFQVRKLGLAAQSRMKKDFCGRANEFREAAGSFVAQALGINVRRWPQAESIAFANWSTVLYLIEDLPKWSSAEKKLAVEIIRAKGSRTEAEFLDLMQTHDRLLDAVCAIGSRPTEARGDD